MDEIVDQGLEIAIVGMAGRFPGAESISEYWENLVSGRESISRLSDEQLRASGVDEALVNDPTYVKATPKLKGDAAEFDASFFGYSPREAQFMDPQQRLFLETAWHAVEHAGYAPRALTFPVGVFGGAAMNTYFMKTGLAERFDEEYLPTLIGNDNSFLATRVSYKLNLVGPSITVQTACSTSLVAVHEACQSLLNNECDMALAGGVSIRIPQDSGYRYQEDSVASPDGHCRAFDARAQGTLFGSGVGVVVLKRLEDALENRDQILAVIKGSAINNDGSSKADYTAPSVNSQAEVVAEALSVAGVSADSISYVEAHGTGTFLGDPIEVTALTKAFRSDTQRSGYCAIGSVKTNIGHLDAAAGVAGLIKCVLALHHRQIPASLHFESPNPQIDFERSPFYVNDQLRDWNPAQDSPRRAGITSLGIGGTNAHIVLEEGPTVESSSPARRYQLLCWSGRTAAARDAIADNLAKTLQSSEVALADMAYTLQVGRTRFKHRGIAVLPEDGIAKKSVAAELQARVLHADADDVQPEPVFLFSGQGTQYPNMTRDLFEREPYYRDTVERCLEILSSERSGSDDPQLRELLFPAPDQEASAADRLKQTAITQPAMFTIEYSLAKLFMHWGIQPAVLAGHSLGEYVAACLAGVFTLEDALRLVAKRGRLMQQLPEGAMLAVMSPEAEVRNLIDDQLAVALINSPTICVVAGETEAVADFQAKLEKDRIEYRPLRTSHAFHSEMMQPMVGELGQLIAAANPQRPKLPLVSNVSGTWMSVQDAVDPNYWTKQLLSTVRFHDCLSTLLAEPDRVLIEMGPGNTLVGLARQHPDRKDSHTAVATCRHTREKTDDDAFALKALGQIWSAGVDVDWNTYYAAETRKRVALPGYPFERQRHWYQGSSKQSNSTIQRRANLRDWFYAPSWTRSHSPKKDIGTIPETWCIVSDVHKVSDKLVELCRNAGGQAFVVSRGHGFSQADQHHFTVGQDPQQMRGDFEKVMSAVTQHANQLHRVFYLSASSRDAASEQAQFFELFHLLNAVSEADIVLHDPLSLCVAAEGLTEVLPGDRVDPFQALVLGPARVVAKEQPGLTSTIVDIAFSQGDAGDVAETLLQESSLPSDGEIIAWRNSQRWRQSMEPLPLESDAGDAGGLRRGGVYLITGGLGGIGMVVARHLADHFAARLILTSRTELPPRDQWSEVLQNSDSSDVRSKVNAVRELEELGAEVLTVSGDIADKDHVSTVAELIAERFGRLDGVFHLAALVRDGAMNLKALQTSQEVLSPKVTGTMHLAEVLRPLAPDFIVLFSSINALRAPAGQSDYASANSFLDAYAQHSNGPTRILSINWPAWQQVGLLSDLPDSSWRRAALARGISPQEGLEALERALVQTASRQILVSPTQFDFPMRAVSDEAASGSDGALDTPSSAKPTDADVALTGYANTVEARLAQVWEELLGVDRPAASDNYFDLGGSSLLATQMIARIQQRFGVKLSIRSILDHPTIAMLATQIPSEEETSEDIGQADVAAMDAVSERLNTELDRTLPPSTVGSANAEGPVPLSSSQLRMWNLSKLHPHSRADNLPHGYRFKGSLNIEALKRAFEAIVQRHDVLRTLFPVHDGAPIQIVQDQIELPWTVVDLSQVPANDVERELQRKLTDAARHEFDLEHGPLLQLTLFQLRANEHVLLLNTHHIVSDGWSYTIFERELESWYGAFVEGSQPTLEPLAIQYADYVYWEQQQAENTEHLQYWQNQLAGDLPYSEFPTDSARPPVQTFEGEKCFLELPLNTYQQMRAVCQSEQATTFMGLLAGLYGLVHRYTGVRDVVIGTPASLRSSPETEPLVGIFLNVLALKAKVDGNLSGRGLLRRSRDTTLDGQSHQSIPFNRVVEQLGHAIDPGRSPLFQIMLEVSRDNQPRLTGLQAESFFIDGKTAQYDLAIHLRESDTGIRGYVEYNSALYQRATVRRLLDHFMTLLDSMFSNPDTPLGDLELLHEEERTRQLVLWNQNPSDDEIDTCMHTVVHEQSIRCPDRVAVECSGRQVTYRQLEDESDLLAAELCRLGVSVGDKVGVCLDRSSNLLVALLAILKTGAAYVPLDPSFPADRLAYMVSDSAAPVLLTQQSLLPLPFEHRATTVCLDGDWRNQGATQHGVLPSVDPTDAAYVIYTSGSTGRPKGVQISHRAAVNFLKSMARVPGMTEADTILAITTLSFDISVLELFLPLFVGAKTFVVNKEDALDGHRLAELIATTRATLMQATPATWRMLLSTGWTGAERPFKALCGGEPLPMDLARELHSRCSELWNMYGPTETTVWSTIAQILPSDDYITIGHPIHNTEIYILDDRLQPAPVGVPGILYIGGAGLADGYHQRPELTNEKFIEHPFSDTSGKRIYNTGDLARYDSRGDGTIEHLGRIDGQVKIRGFRIELGEIESVLARHPGVARAVVVDREELGERILVGYLVMSQGSLPSISELRQFLSKSLPAYMIPAAFVGLDEIPLTPNKKVDRKALPAPESARPELGQDYVAATDHVQQELVVIWEHILKRHPVGVRDNFFDLGGNSLKAVQLFNTIESTYAHRLSLASLFQAPTIETLAALLAQHDHGERRQAAWECLVPIKPSGSKPPLYLIHAAGGNVLLYKDLADATDADQPVFGLQSVGLDGKTEPHDRVESMAEHYLEEILAHQPHGPYYLGGYCLGGTIALDIAQRLRDRGEQVGLLALIETYNWGRMERMSWTKRLRFLVEQLLFHGVNVASLSAGQRRAFLQGKFQIGRQRLAMKLRDLGKKLIGASPRIESVVRLTNHRASFSYQATRYSGRITHFRPQREYTVTRNEEARWDDLADDGVDSIFLKAHPAGTLLAPFATQLAAEIDRRIPQPVQPTETESIAEPVVAATR